MLTMPELISRKEIEVEDAEDEATRCRDTLTRLRHKVSAGEEVPEHRVQAEIRSHDKAQRVVQRMRKELDQLRADHAEDERVAALSRIMIPTGVGMPIREQGTATVSHREVYSREGAARGERSFLTDLFRAQLLQDPQAAQRLADHGATVAPQHSRDVGTSSVAGFTPPQYLINLFAEFARAGRPVANLATPLPLPERGMKVTVPRITTPTQVGVQSAEAGAVTDSDPDDTLLEVDVVTVAGYVDVSRQAVERGELVEEVLFADLAAAYNATLDAQCLNGTGLNGQHLGLRNVSGVNGVAYTDSSPTLPELYPILAKAAGLIVSGRFTGPTHFVMHPTTWAWLVSRLDTTNRPLVVPGGQGPSNALGNTTAPAYGGFAGNLLGVPVVLDGNVGTAYGTGTDQTEIYCVAASDMILWEDASKAPAQLRFDDVLSGTLQCRLLAYGFSAFTAGRQPKAVSVISGTGLAGLTP